jgi:hypothetical protein
VEFATNLQAQGWKETAGSLIGPRNAILKREPGAAKLTIMIQPADAGSQVKGFTEGLDWKTGGDAKLKPAATDDVEKVANDLIQKALKNVPKGVLDKP